jgi:histidinol-phosphate aminotransferase
MIVPPLTPLAESLPATVPFVGPEAQERANGKPFLARLGANESGFGPSPRVVAAMRDAAPDMWKYCDPESYELRAALATHHGLKAENVVIGEGIDALLGLAVRLWAAPGRAVVTSLGAYPTFNYHVAGFGAALVAVPYRDDREDLTGLLDAVRQNDAPLVYLANPDNPMGTWWPAADVQAFIAALPETTMLILDEAYGETAPAEALPPLDLRPNVLRMRTFSKAYGLAGLRCGMAIGEARAIRAFEKVRNHFGMTRMTQAAALAALADQAWMLDAVTRIAEARARIGAIGASHGLVAVPSATNFVTLDCGRDGVFAKAVLDGLVAEGIFVRKPMAPGLDRCIRVSCGPEPELDLFAESLARMLGSLR